MLTDKYPIVREDEKVIFYPVSRTVYLSNGVRLSSCGFVCCRFPTLTCNNCYYGT